MKRQKQFMTKVNMMIRQIIEPKHMWNIVLHSWSIIDMIVLYNWSITDMITNIKDVFSNIKIMMITKLKGTRKPVLAKSSKSIKQSMLNIKAILPRNIMILIMKLRRGWRRLYPAAEPLAPGKAMVVLCCCSRPARCSAEKGCREEAPLQVHQRVVVPAPTLPKNVIARLHPSRWSSRRRCVPEAYSSISGARRRWNGRNLRCWKVVVYFAKRT